jgi:TusA-related sulfurtransferase
MAMEQGGAAVGAAETEAPQQGGKVVRFDCGWVGCDEMPMIVRRQLQEVEVGDIVEFVVREPSSKEDTPPFCRMLGHRVISTDQQRDGVVVIRVERAR